MVECDDGNMQGRTKSVCQAEEQQKLLMVIPFALTGGASATSTTVSGTITDSSGNTITNATLKSEPEGVDTTVTDGSFTATNVPAGTYTITVTNSDGTTLGTFTLTVDTTGNVTVSNASSGLVVTAGGSSSGEVTTPSFSPAAGSYNTDQTITITSTTTDATIYYTTNGDSPTTSSEASASYTINYDAVATPTFGITAGTYNTDQSVTLGTTTSGATIYYTTNGDTPTTSSSQYSSAISVTGDGTTMTVKAIAVKDGMTNSSEASATYTINYDSVDLWNGIVAYYPFNGNAKDESGTNNNDGTASGATLAADKFGNSNRAYSFDGDDDYIQTGTFNDNWSNWTISAYLKANQFNTYNMILEREKVGSYNDFEIYIRADNNKIQSDMDNASDTGIISITAISTNTWYHVLISYDGTNRKLYINGNLDTEDTTSNAHINVAEPILIGKHVSDSRYFDGFLDNIRIYNRALNATEIQQLYKNSATAPTPGNSGTITASSVTDTSLTLSWEKASDGAATDEYSTPEAKLQYKVIQSSSNNIDTVDNANANGTVVQNWSTDINSSAVSGLTAGTTYYFNVLVRDEHGNMGSYGMVARPITFSPTPGTFYFADSPTIIISTTTAGATIYYTTDGTTPTTSSTQFVTGISLISVAEFLKIKAYAVKSGWTDSAVASGDYYLMSPLLKTGQTTCASGADGTGAMAACSQTITGQDGDYQKGTTMSYTDNGNGTITDNVTGLIWQKCSMGQDSLDCSSGPGPMAAAPVKWATAITYCDELDLGGSSDWRLPGIKQLESLIDYGTYNPPINNLFTNTATDYHGYWSSSTYVGTTSSAWVVFFGSGRTLFDHKTDSNYVRCVRGL